MSGKKRRGGHEEEHENHERWLVTYADMLTLLMVLFIVMFAMSSIDAKKFEVLKESLAGAFPGSPSPVSGGDGMGPEDAGAASSPMDVASVQVPNTDANRQQQDKQAVLDYERTKASQAAQAAKQEASNLQQVQKAIEQALAAQGLANDVQFEITERGLTVRIVTSSIVFAGDSAQLLAAGQQIVGAIAPAIAGLPNAVEVDGHTNQLNVPTVNYPSGWELSGARAASVVRYLIDHGLGANRMSAVGFADQHPLIPPSDPASIVRNRRVEVIVLSAAPADVRALLPSAAGQTTTTGTG